MIRHKTGDFEIKQKSEFFFQKTAALATTHKKTDDKKQEKESNRTKISETARRRKSETHSTHPKVAVNFKGEDLRMCKDLRELMVEDKKVKEVLDVRHRMSRKRTISYEKEIYKPGLDYRSRQSRKRFQSEHRREPQKETRRSLSRKSTEPQDDKIDKRKGTYYPGLQRFGDVKSRRQTI